MGGIPGKTTPQLLKEMQQEIQRLNERIKKLEDELSLSVNITIREELKAKLITAIANIEKDLDKD